MDVALGDAGFIAFITDLLHSAVYIYYSFALSPKLYPSI
jgi:hypothetical protein